MIDQIRCICRSKQCFLPYLVFFSNCVGKKLPDFLHSGFLGFGCLGQDHADSDQGSLSHKIGAISQQGLQQINCTLYNVKKREW